MVDCSQALGINSSFTVCSVRTGFSRRQGPSFCLPHLHKPKAPPTCRALQKPSTSHLQQPLPSPTPPTSTHHQNQLLTTHNHTQQQSRVSAHLPPPRLSHNPPHNTNCHHVFRGRAAGQAHLQRQCRDHHWYAPHLTSQLLWRIIADFFPAERKIAERSMLIKNMIEDLGAPGEEPIPIMNVS